MEKWFKKHFAMNRKELQGLSFLTIVVIALWFLPAIYSWLRPVEEDPAFEHKVKQIEDFLAANAHEADLSAPEPTVTTHDPVERETEYFPFDPNKLTADEGKRLGLSERQVRMIGNYVSKGGKFHKREDFAKIYAITESDFKRLYPYIQIDGTENSSNQTSKPTTSTPATQEARFQKVAAKDVLIELNATDSIGLQELWGIGPVFASRIVRYRDLLGGFHNKTQLLEVYGMDEERFRGIENNILVDSLQVQKINVNKVDYRTLLKHPYISPKLANVIVAYRNQHGSYETPEDLLNIELLDEDFLRKIVPYLAFTDD